MSVATEVDKKKHWCQRMKASQTTVIWTNFHKRRGEAVPVKVVEVGDRLFVKVIGEEKLGKQKARPEDLLDAAEASQRFRPATPKEPDPPPAQIAPVPSAEDLELERLIAEEAEQERQHAAAAQAPPPPAHNQEPAMPLDATVETANPFAGARQSERDRKAGGNAWIIIDTKNRKFWAGGHVGFHDMTQMEKDHQLIRLGTLHNTLDNLRNPPPGYRFRGKYDPHSLVVMTYQNAKKFARNEPYQLFELPDREKPKGDAPQPVPTAVLPPDLGHVVAGLSVPQTVLAAKRRESQSFAEMMTLRQRLDEMSDEVQRAKKVLEAAEGIKRDALAAEDKWLKAQRATAEIVRGTLPERPAPLAPDPDGGGEVHGGAPECETATAESQG